MTADTKLIHKLFLVAPGPRPPFYEVVEHVYGSSANVDTEGNSATREAVDWTMLYMTLRPSGHQPIVEVYPLDHEATVLCIESIDGSLASKTAEFLHRSCGGAITATPPNS